MQGFVYILQNDKNQRYYIGSAIDLDKRLLQHKNGKVKATKYLLPIKLVFSQEYKTIKEARQIEYKLKKLKRKDVIERIISEGVIKLGS